MDGTELLQRLRAAGGGPASIVLTVHASLTEERSLDPWNLGAISLPYPSQNGIRLAAAATC
jgi:hypothetical protein